MSCQFPGGPDMSAQVTKNFKFYGDLSAEEVFGIVRSDCDG